VSVHETHLSPRRLGAVCGALRSPRAVFYVPDLLVHPTACKRCLEWVVEQGQLAARRLAESETTNEEPQ
jgi:hypothetical protein